MSWHDICHVAQGVKMSFKKKRVVRPPVDRRKHLGFPEFYEKWGIPKEKK